MEPIELLMSFSDPVEFICSVVSADNVINGKPVFSPARYGLLASRQSRLTYRKKCYAVLESWKLGVPSEALKHMVQYHLDVVNHIPLLREAHAKAQQQSASPTAAASPSYDFPDDLAEDDSDMWFDEPEEKTIEQVHQRFRLVLSMF